MKKLLDQVATEEVKALEVFLKHGKQRILANREFCGLSISDFTTFYFEVHNGKLADALTKFALTANCDNSNTLLSLLGFQEFAHDAFDDFLEANEKPILKAFRDEVNEGKEEIALAAAGV
ncbi:hypothetical protein ACN08N_23695 [Photobacterium leiognathi subsp. mandapamensis]|uniref:hypothetical protein n=1 Tax=Photobacterium leiognathi TaxID=553611 RepID=UPI003AF35441